MRTLSRLSVSQEVKLVAIWTTAVIGLTLTASAQNQTVVAESIVRIVIRGDLATLQARISAGADPNETDDSVVKGWTPLMAAAYSGNVDAARLLLDSGAAIDAKTEFGKTAIDIAIAGGKAQVAEILGKRGAKVTAPLKAQAPPAQTKVPPLLLRPLPAAPAGAPAALAANTSTGQQSGSGTGERENPALEMLRGNMASLQTSFLIVPASTKGPCSSYVPNYADYHSVVEIVDNQPWGWGGPGSSDSAPLPIYKVNTHGRDPVSGEERRLRSAVVMGFDPLKSDTNQPMRLENHFGEPGTRITFNGDPSHPFAPAPGISVWDGSIDIDPKCGTLIRAKGFPNGAKGSRSSPPTTDSTSLVLQVQQLLKKLGYDPGSIDGKLGIRTVEAIKEFQRSENRPADGRASPELLKTLESRDSTRR